ncbi:MAG: hypothetical protein AAF950_10550 [Pseudomonadota bacterium]
MNRLFISAIASIATIATAAMAETTDSGAPCDVAELSVYFPHQETELTDAAERAFLAEAEEIGTCRIAQISATVISADGKDTYEADALSAARATTVLSALMSAELASPDHMIPVNVISLGDASDEAAVPLARRVDVQIVPVAALSS